jgi:hypothetical protein
VCKRVSATSARLATYIILHLTPSACFAGDDLFALLYIIIIISITVKPRVQIVLVYHSIFHAPLVNRCSSSVFQRIECLCVTARRHITILPLLFASTVSSKICRYTV